MRVCRASVEAQQRFDYLPLMTTLKTRFAALKLACDGTLDVAKVFASIDLVGDMEGQASEASLRGITVQNAMSLLARLLKERKLPWPIADFDKCQALRQLSLRVALVGEAAQLALISLSARKKPVKNKSGQHRNEQQGYHPQDLVVSQIFLHCVETGTVTPQQARFGDALPDRKALRRMSADLRAAAAMLFDAEQAPWWSAPMAKVQLKKKGSIALLRNRTRRVLKRWRKKRRARERVA